MKDPNYGDQPSDDSEPADEPISASIGSGLSNPKADMIEAIMAYSTPITPPSPTTGTSTTTGPQYNPEELAKKTIWELRRILRDEKHTLPLSQRFDKKDRQLAFQSEEYQQALADIDDPDNPDLTDVEPIDLTDEF